MYKSCHPLKIEDGGEASCPTVCLPVVLHVDMKDSILTYNYKPGRLMGGAKKTTRYPPATTANGATAEAIAKALLAPLKPPQKT